MAELKNIKKITIAFFAMGLIVCNSAFSQGPNAPEAASFEPVDATDMVNLVTGDMSYVLPLLNVPSPEGGYPITLSYHAGIAMDQEASWVGLGWNINPGAINRSINGYPDDWNSEIVNDYFYDKGGEDTYYTASIGATFANVFSTGLSYSWGNNRASAGSVYFGVGINGFSSVGVSASTTGNFSIYGSFGLGKDSPFSIGGSIGTNGVGVNAGVTGGNSNLSAQLNVGYNGEVSGNLNFSTGEKFKKSSLGINFSSSGTGYSGKVNGLGVGVNLAASSTYKQDDYVVTQKGYNITIPAFYFSAGFSKQTIKYSLNKEASTYLTGGLYFDEPRFALQYKCCFNGNPSICTDWSDTPQCSNPNFRVTETRIHENTIMDVYEIPINNQNANIQLDSNNSVLPNLDTYNVAAQGLSGTMKAIYRESGMLVGLGKEIGEQGDRFNVKYKTANGQSGVRKEILEFNSGPNFHFENELTSSLTVTPLGYNSRQSNNIFDQIDTSSGNLIEPVKKKARFVEYFTKHSLNSKTYTDHGLLMPSEDYNYADEDYTLGTGLGSEVVAYKITTPDGKSYHYALPVYNREMITRQFGLFKNRRGKEDSYIEKRLKKNYATHWLLTAITGPDFIDDGDGVAGLGDLGYWVSFDYGKWSDSHVWYAPYGKEYNEDSKDSNIKSYTFGRKEIYYLDKISTRTHIAFFVKEERLDSKGKALVYNERKNASTVRPIEFRSQELLRLKEIILVKNIPSNYNFLKKENKVNLTISPAPHTYVNNGRQNYSLQDNVIDRSDLTANEWITFKNKALKIVDLSSHYSYSLAQNTPNSSSGRLTLDGVNFKGRKGVQTIPPYNFEYYNFEGFNWNNKNDWGYNDIPYDWSLKSIKTPIGTHMKIIYESDEFYTSVNQKIDFMSSNNKYNASGMNRTTREFYIDSKVNSLGIKVGERIENVTYEQIYELTKYSYSGTATVGEEIAANKFKVKLDGSINESQVTGPAPIYNDKGTITATYKVVNQLKDGGLRVKDISVSDNIYNTNPFKTVYSYESNNRTSGKVSYVPFWEGASKQVPYGSLLPSPVVMYKNVKTTSYDSNNSLINYSKYQFNVFPDKVPNKIKFGDVLEIESTENNYTNAAGKKVNIANILVKDNTAILGQLLTSESFNEKDQLLSKIKNNYDSKENIDQGIVQQSFQSYKDIDYNNDDHRDKWLINSSTYKTYPSSLLSSSVLNAGHSATTLFKEHDKNTGQLIESETTTSNGDTFKTKIIPAYTISNYSGDANGYGMGSKVNNLTNRHMLTQPAVSLTQIKKGNTWKLINAGITTWNNNWKYVNTNGGISNPVTLNEKIWRKHKMFIWDGEINADGIYQSFVGDDNFNWGVGNYIPDPTTGEMIYNILQPNAKWKNVSETSLYDHYSMPLEVKDINNNNASTKMCDNDSKVSVFVNARYGEAFYSGAEYSNTNPGFTAYLDQGIKGVAYRSNDYAHTGLYSLKISSSSQRGFETILRSGQHDAGKYKISVWVKKSNVLNARIHVNGATKPFNGEKINAGDWVLLNHYEELQTPNETLYITSASGTVYMDDFRIHPIASSMVSYVYNEYNELAYLTGSNGLSNYYIYDSQGRLVETQKETVDSPTISGGFKKISENSYNYKITE